MPLNVFAYMNKIRLSIRPILLMRFRMFKFGSKESSLRFTYKNTKKGTHSNQLALVLKTAGYNYRKVYVSHSIYDDDYRRHQWQKSSEMCVYFSSFFLNKSLQVVY